MSADPHQILGVAPDAEPEVVDAAYRALMKKYHPDRSPGDQLAMRRAQAINSAYAALKSGLASVDGSWPGGPQEVERWEEPHHEVRRWTPPRPLLAFVTALLIIVACVWLSRP